MPAGRPLKFNNVEELQTQIDDYFNKESDRPTITGLALHLDTTRRTLLDYEAKDDEYSHTIKKAKTRVEAFIESGLYGNSVTGLIFNLKNNFDWKDKTETDITTKGESINTNTVVAEDFAKYLKDTSKNTWQLFWL